MTSGRCARKRGRHGPFRVASAGAPRPPTAANDGSPPRPAEPGPGSGREPGGARASRPPGHRGPSASRERGRPARKRAGDPPHGKAGGMPALPGSRAADDPPPFRRRPRWARVRCAEDGDRFRHGGGIGARVPALPRRRGTGGSSDRCRSRGPGPDPGRTAPSSGACSSRPRARGGAGTGARARVDRRFAAVEHVRPQEALESAACRAEASG